MAQKKENIAKVVNLRNKKAGFEFEFLDTYIAGIVLKGTEIKSIRQSQVNMQDAYCFFHGDELLIKNLHISQYKEGTHYNHEPLRDRKLLLQKKELEKLQKKSEEKGLTIIPVRLFINDRGFAKMEIALARGKKLYDKREDIKSKDIKRELDRTRF
ncbi:MAG: SsrA-binding protein SmpB [Cytophagaceae bacterium]